MHWKIEKARPRDAAEVKAIEHEAGLSAWPLKDYASEALRENSVFLVARDLETGALNGFIIVRLITHPNELQDGLSVAFEAELLNLGVLSSSRRKGLGRNLLDEALTSLRRVGCATVYLEVRARNMAAISFYQRFGFECVGRRPDFYKDPSDDAILMTLRV